MSANYDYPYKMAPMYDEGPEVAPQSIPEVYHPPPQAPSYHSPHQHPVTPVKREDSMYPGYIPTPVDQSVYGGQSVYQQNQPGYNASQTAPTTKPKRTFCGCTFVVLVLSIIIAILAAGVIGLAAGTGVVASRASNAEEKLAALSSSLPVATRTRTVTQTASTVPTATSLADLSNGCAVDDSTTTGQTYTAQFFKTPVFTMFCNKNAPNPPLMSLFTADFNTCMDACAAYSDYLPGLFGQNVNTTCQAVSFIPLWTTKQGALEGGAPGNCYLKPGPQTTSGLEDSNVGTDCHAAVRTES